MVGTRRVGLLLALGLVSLCKADDENFGKNNAGIATQTVVQVANKSENSDIATQAVVQDSKGGEIRVVTTIRDTSWPSSIVYSPMSFYELLPQFYKDKVSVREVVLSKPDWFFSIFCSAIPRQWHPTSDKVTTWHLDLFDAMTLGVQDANVKIVQATLSQIPYSKSILSSGKSTDFINNQAVTVNGKFKIDQFIDLACDSMETRINKQRIIKWLATGSVVALGACEYQNITYSDKLIGLCKEIFGETLRDTFTIKVDINITTNNTPVVDAQKQPKGRIWGPYVMMSAGAVVTALAHRLQHLYVGGYIKVLDMLVSAEGVTFDHKVTYEKIKALKEKVQWFGLSNNEGERLQMVLNKL